MTLGLSMNDYCIADCIYHYTANPKSPVPGWCFASKQSIADQIGITKSWVIKSLNTLEEKGIIEKSADGRLVRTTDKWYSCSVNRDYTDGVRNTPISVNDVHRSGVESTPPSYNKIYNQNVNVSSPDGDPSVQPELEFSRESIKPEPSKKAPRPKNEDFPEYTAFIEKFNAKYPHMLTFPRDGAKVKSLIKQCRQQLKARGKDPTTEHVVAFWEIFVGNLEKTWGHGKDLSTIDSKFNSLVFEIEHGKKQTDNDRYNARTAAQRYVDNL